MNVTVVGQKGNGPVLRRTVTPTEFYEAWGPYANFLWRNARRQTVVIDGHRVRVILHG